jgi:hypothetical protein
MKKVTLLCGLLLAVSATIASAAPGVGLRWTDCIGDGGAANKNFACNANTGSNVLVGTFELGAVGLGTTSGEEIIIDIAAAGATLPAWWAFKNAGTCRSGSLAIGSALPLSAAGGCSDWAAGGATAGIGAYNIGQRGPNTARVIAASAVAPDALQDLLGGTEYFSFALTINNLKTVGTGLCAGCNVAACIVFNSLNMTTPILANNVKISGASNGTDSNFATWQGGAGVVVAPYPGGNGGTGCPQATPTQNKTWGAVKSMYHN